MACEIVGTDRTLFVAWGTPQIVDLERALEQLRLRAELTKGLIFYVTRVPSEAPAPEPEVRRHISQRLATVVEHCSQYHVILEGDGFASAVKRGVLLSLFQFTQKRGMFHVHATVQSFRRVIPLEWRAEVTSLLDLAEKRELLEGVIPGERKLGGTGTLSADGAMRKKPSNVA